MRRHLHVCWALLALLAIQAGACYRPDFPDGTMACAAGNACPEGFRCLDGVCSRGPTDAAIAEDTGPDLAQDLNGGDDVACPLPFPECNVGTSGACDPVCQSGCASCQRCTVTSAGKASCVSGRGLLGEGDRCSVDSSGDDLCAPGLLCVANSCYARCARLCHDDRECQGSRCNIVLPGGFSACDVPATGCNPVGTATVGCPAPLTCYLLGPDRSGCDCPGGDPVAAGQTCTLQRQCIPGYTCVVLFGLAQCRPVCNLSGGTCPVGFGTCQAYGQPLSTIWGYCAP